MLIVKKINIFGFYDCPEEKTDTDYFIIIPPAFGETKKSGLYISYFTE